MFGQPDFVLGPHEKKISNIEPCYYVARLVREDIPQYGRHDIAGAFSKMTLRAYDTGVVTI